MKFDIIITHIGNPKAKNIIARHLAHDPSISLQKALSMLENPPVVYMTGVLKDDAQYHLRQLEKIQVSAKCVAVQLAPLLPHSVPGFVPEHSAAPQPPPSQPKPAPHPLPASPPPAAPVRTVVGIPSSGVPRTGAGMTKNRIILISSISAVLAVMVIVVLALKGTFNWGHAFSLDWSKAGLVAGDSASKKAGAKKAKQDRTNHDSAEKRADRNAGPDDAGPDADAATEEQKASADACIDSGKTAPDVSRAISFYQLAIAFNKRNVNAWYALHDAYASAEMNEQATTTETAMRRLFGDNIFSVAKIVEPFGTVKTTSMTRDGIYRLEYQAREQDPAKNLLGDYLLMKALKGSCLCNAISLYARTSAGKGTLVYARTESFPASFDEFRASANITYLK
jgi:hypothetical protein